MHQMHYELRNLRHFVALMNHRSFSLAAQAVSLSQPAFSRSIQALEHQAGCKLVEREHKGLPPTAQGQLVLSYALDILGKAHELGEKISRLNSADRDMLYFGCGPAPAAGLVPRTLARFIGWQPQVNAHFVVDTRENLNRRLMAEEIEFFIASLQSFELDPNYRIRQLQPRSWCFFCRHDHPLATLKGITREQLLVFPMVCSFGVRSLVLQYSGRRDYLPAVECENGRPLLDIVLQSDAIGCASQLQLSLAAEEGARLHQLKPVDISPDLEALQIRDGVVSLRRHVLSPQAEAFIELLQAMDQAPGGDASVA
ncbi:LysR family transcriptional regulator [Pseudomonas putida]|uniref:LysR family transcriptional regulator n=1 Tax=Pseudomonas putida TaxID=303 RepID=UPI003839E658